MNSSINLVSTRSDALEREQRLLLILRVIAVVLLVAIAFFSIAAFIITTQIPISKIKSEQAQTLSQISASPKKLSSYFLIKDRLNNINSLLASRMDYTASIDSVFSKIPENVTVDSMSIESRLIQIEMSSASLRSIDEVIHSLVSLGSDGKVIKSVKLESLTLNAQAGRYSVSFSAEVL
ncbi:MAG: hypothetical protein A2798_02805 [Candidatus Levybacteria bacterium RIFCSPHIGHO2_01_FULL_37_17]|nr:MAG: hypothetical protein A2798_02805 [Candidatus Levybacteria bacterium RIFCSPHIGHO2_01_FULL_37_17]OGH36786.1 MAG: hypothetical protein A2959_00795 [Candidatus Levybacteria bacterium RIFCSPLOWO2_01_FULL_38_23]